MNEDIKQTNKCRYTFVCQLTPEHLFTGFKGRYSNLRHIINKGLRTISV